MNKGLNRKTLGRWLALLFLAIAVPTAVLVHRAYTELRWEAFHQYRLQAEQLAARIDSRFGELIDREEQRSFTDYTFLNFAGDPSAHFLQRSPLSSYPVATDIPGLIGYFQIDAEGLFSTPLLPEGGTAPAVFGIRAQDLRQRQALAARIRRILNDNRLVQVTAVDTENRQRESTGPRQEKPRLDAPVAVQAVREEVVDGQPGGLEYAEQEALPAQAGFDQLEEKSKRVLQQRPSAASSLGRLDELRLDDSFQLASPSAKQKQQASRAAQPVEKRARKERAVLPAPDDTASPDPESAVAPKPVSTFESELDPFEISLLESGHFVLFRKVWRDGQRYIQGALIERQPLLDGVAGRLFRAAALPSTSDLVLAYGGDVLAAYSGNGAARYPVSTGELGGALLHRNRLSAPLDGLELVFSARSLPAGPGGTVIIWSASILLLLLCGGWYLLYRAGSRQIDLLQQQQDFVSAVSHELKTPLTSIRMYGEMLRDGWAPEQRKQTYYDYIYDESERLSRLIENVLQLARMDRNQTPGKLRETTVSDLLDAVRSKVAAQAERAGLTLVVNCPGEAGNAVLLVDSDWFSQIFINLVDNAVKFSADSERRQIDIGCRLQRSRVLLFSVRDYGPGIAPNQMKKIFELFYRSENELTRETVGTGIGLALVRRLTAAMNGRVDVVNRQPGAEFRLSFDCRTRKLP